MCHSEMWKGTLIKEMTEAGEEEKCWQRLQEISARMAPPMDHRSVDGGWSHRSHGHRYSANSGGLSS
ncbi:hypothetical protein HPB52_019383 [Rhipicephalus sanguineus]|uniref:Uncharacterized protein n=1 Tax=Rhipicephalus sanguineus TaxID=34632 RepID=A0A9D4SQN2_RHISA|nr:hypothetical protein HPB52_019383 [Rhipicephalus sanguineus]